VLVAGLAGLWRMRDRGAQLVPLGGLLVATTLSALLAYGNARFRTVSEPVLLVGAAALVTSLRSPSSPRRRTASLR
jgi:hypothetical protein